MDAALKVVTQIPLTELWRDDGFTTTSRVRWLTADDITSLLRAGRVQFVVADAGDGVPGTLRRTHTKITSDQEALELAVREGVTRDKAIGQGNGLFGSYEICLQSTGEFKLKSGYAELSLIQSDPRISPLTTPYTGTLVICGIGYEKASLLESILRFKEKGHSLDGIVDMRWEVDDNTVRYNLSEQEGSYGNRKNGEKVRFAIRNLINMLDAHQRLAIDLDGIPLMSSSFADEVFGKLFLDLGLPEFRKIIALENASPENTLLIQRALGQRASDEER